MHDKLIELDNNNIDFIDNMLLEAGLLFEKEGSLQDATSNLNKYLAVEKSEVYKTRTQLDLIEVNHSINTLQYLDNIKSTYLYNQLSIEFWKVHIKMHMGIFGGLIDTLFNLLNTMNTEEKLLSIEEPYRIQNEFIT